MHMFLFFCSFPRSRSPVLRLPAGIFLVFAHGAPEEALAAVAGDGVVVFAGGLVGADGARLVTGGRVYLRDRRRLVVLHLHWKG